MPSIGNKHAFFSQSKASNNENIGSAYTTKNIVPRSFDDFKRKAFYIWVINILKGSCLHNSLQLQENCIW